MPQRMNGINGTLLPCQPIRRLSVIEGRIQTISATPSNLTRVRRCAMVTSRIWFAAAQKAELSCWPVDPADVDADAARSRSEQGP
jgi:hypothetical protein